MKKKEKMNYQCIKRFYEQLHRELESVLNGDDSDELVCCICYDDTSGCEIERLPNCGHVFHEECIKLYACNKLNLRMRKCNRDKLIETFPVNCPICRVISRVHVGKTMLECEMMIMKYK